MNPAPIAKTTEPAPKTRGEPEQRPLVVLVGRPNSGKSSLFNAVTGGDAHVGNFPGVTVDILEADLRLPSGAELTMCDLPGLYSLDAVVDAGTDEAVARTFIDAAVASGRRTIVAQVADATRLALGLRLTRELLARGLELVVIVTQRDVLEAEGRALDVDELRETLGARTLLVSARDRAARPAILEALDEQLRDGARPESRGHFDVESVARAVVADQPKVTAEAKKRRALTERADELLLHPVLGPVLFLGLMALTFAAVFLIADPASDAMDKVVGLARGGIVKALGDGLVASFLSDGVLGGAGTVLAFMPQIVVLTVAMELLEASGYLARGAFLVDRLLRLLGLSGRSFLPLLMGHACAVPAITATRIIRDPKERLTTILVLPLMTCSARLPTYSLLIGAFFGHRSALFQSALFVCLYFAGILSGLAASLVLRRTATSGRSLPLVLEMPAYRMPQARVMARKTWKTAVRFLRDVGTTIVIVAAILWALLEVPMPGTDAAAPPVERSVAARVGTALEPVTRPAGFDWRINVGLIGAFGQREVMVGTLGVIFGLESAGDDDASLRQRLREAKKPDGTPIYTTRNALALLAFFVLAAQCMSTMAAIRRETKSWKWPAFVMAYTYGVAYAAAVLVYQLGGLFE
jgi:ferrous iron transport protein B